MLERLVVVLPMVAGCGATVAAADFDAAAAHARFIDAFKTGSGTRSRRCLPRSRVAAGRAPDQPSVRMDRVVAERVGVADVVDLEGLKAFEKPPRLDR